MRQPVPLEDLRAELEEWLRQLARAAEGWVRAHAAGLPTDHYDAQMREAERNSRRLERRIRRRRRAR